MKMTIRFKRLAASCLVAGAVFAGTATASASASQPDPPVSDEASRVAPADEQPESMNLRSRFSAADVHPSEDQADTTDSVQTLPIGPQYRISSHATLGGSLEQSDVGDFAAGPQADRYTFGFRLAF